MTTKRREQLGLPCVPAPPPEPERQPYAETTAPAPFESMCSHARAVTSISTGGQSVLFIRCASSQLRRDLKSWCQDNEVTSEAQAARLLLRRQLNTEGYGVTIRPRQETRR